MIVERARRGLFLLLWLCLSSELALACRYNVRDIGFVDLETESYHLYQFVNSETPAETVALLRTMAAEALRDCNLSVETINAGVQTNHPALKYLGQDAAGSSPAAALVSPDGQTLPISLARANQSFRDGLADALSEIASSPTRDELLQTVSRCFGAVLLIEGDAPEANARARRAIADAIGQMRSQMKSMPKTIAEPPVLIALGASARARERLLLWSLGLGAGPAPEPRAAVIYGRARWIGPLVKGDEITARNLAGILSFIGADCECGLDVSWTQGTRLLVRWDENLHSRVAKALDFDPENPLVKLEASRIIHRSGLLTGRSGQDREGSAPETFLSSKDSTQAAAERTGNARQPASQTSGPAAATAAQAVSHKLLLFGAGLALVVLVSAIALAAIQAAKRRGN
jgi:hypothetical protein